MDYNVDLIPLVVALIEPIAQVLVTLSYPFRVEEQENKLDERK